MLIASTCPGAVTHASVLDQAGFDLEFARDETEAIDICNGRQRTFRAIVVVENDHDSRIRIASLLARLCDLLPSVPCVLLPSGASPTEAEIAVRTAIRWGSLAYIAAAGRR